VTQLRKRMLEELQRRNYSQATTRSYILAVKQFAEYFGQSPEKLGAKEICRYQLYLLNEKKLTPGTVGIRMSALRQMIRRYCSKILEARKSSPWTGKHRKEAEESR